MPMAGRAGSFEIYCSGFPSSLDKMAGFSKKIIPSFLILFLYILVNLE